MADVENANGRAAARLSELVIISVQGSQPHHPFQGRPGQVPVEMGQPGEPLDSGHPHPQPDVINRRLLQHPPHSAGHQSGRHPDCEQDTEPRWL